MEALLRPARARGAHRQQQPGHAGGGERRARRRGRRSAASARIAPTPSSSSAIAGTGTPRPSAAADRERDRPVVAVDLERCSGARGAARRGRRWRSSRDRAQHAPAEGVEDGEAAPGQEHDEGRRAASNSAAVIEIAAKRSPIGKARHLLDPAHAGQRGRSCARRAARAATAARPALRLGPRLGVGAVRAAPRRRGARRSAAASPPASSALLDRRLLGQPDHARLAGAEGEVGEVARRSAA